MTESLPMTQQHLLRYANILHPSINQSSAYSEVFVLRTKITN